MFLPIITRYSYINMSTLEMDGADVGVGPGLCFLGDFVNDGVLEIWQPCAKLYRRRFVFTPSGFYRAAASLGGKIRAIDKTGQPLDAFHVFAPTWRAIHLSRQTWTQWESCQWRQLWLCWLLLCCLSVCSRVRVRVRSWQLCTAGCTCCFRSAPCSSPSAWWTRSCWSCAGAMCAGAVCGQRPGAVAVWSVAAVLLVTVTGPHSAAGRRWLTAAPWWGITCWGLSAPLLCGLWRRW